MTNGAAAALALSKRMLGARMDWSSAFASWSRRELSGLQSNVEVRSTLTKGWITPATRTGRRSPNEDEGSVASRPPWHLEARCRVDGTEHRFHRYARTRGIVTWNDADDAWDRSSR
jgi:hypothetical protein